VLEELGDLCARLWNEITYERRKPSLDERLTKETMRETYKKYYDKYKGLVGSVSVQQVININDKSWNSFFAMLKAKKKGRLLPFIKRVCLPCYWKDRKLGKRIKRFVVKSDRYYEAYKQ